MAAILGALGGMTTDGPKPQLGQGQQPAPSPQPYSLAPQGQPAMSPGPQSETQPEAPQKKEEPKQPTVSMLDILKILGSQK